MLAMYTRVIKCIERAMDGYDTPGQFPARLIPTLAGLYGQFGERADKERKLLAELARARQGFFARTSKAFLVDGDEQLLLVDLAATFCSRDLLDKADATLAAVDKVMRAIGQFSAAE